MTIIHHPDVRRMLMTMKALTEGARALACVAAAASDAGHFAPDVSVRKENMALYEFLVPIVKGWSTEMSLEVASLGVQVHGGMGFIEETGAAQYYRDARILTIYEGTTAIQANDLVGRKTARDGGAIARALISQIRTTVAALRQTDSASLVSIAARLDSACSNLDEVVGYVIGSYKADIRAVFAGSVPYLKLAGITLCGWQMARSALVAYRLKGGDDGTFMSAKISTAQFFAEHVLTQTAGISLSILAGAGSVLELEEAQF